MDIINEIKALQRAEISRKIEQRLKEFESFKDKGNEQWFSELCFCILTANSKARTALEIQQQLGAEGFCKADPGDIRRCIIRCRHRFHNNKTEYITLAREHIDIKEKIRKIVEENGEKEAREWLVKNIKGIGYKEASHFLRNVGYKNIAILDRHIINLMLEYGLIEDKPKTLSRKLYLSIEKKFKIIADRLNMPMAELDLYMWYMKTGEVLK